MEHTKITVIARLTAKPGYEEQVRAQSISLVEPSRAETGNLSYSTFNSATDPREWVVVEEWESREDFERHLASAHMQEAFAVGAEWLAGPPVETVVEG